MLQRLRENCLLRLKTINSIYYANYRRFIQNYSKVATPLTGLTSTIQPFCSNKAETAFICPKPLFTSASILVRPDINLQLIVKVEASGSLDDMLRTLGCCACIAGVATLVGGISSAVLGLDSPHDLPFLHNAKWLNPRQAEWARSLGCFNFILTYRSGHGM